MTSVRRSKKTVTSKVQLRGGRTANKCFALFLRQFLFVPLINFRLRPNPPHILGQNDHELEQLTFATAPLGTVLERSRQQQLSRAGIRNCIQVRGAHVQGRRGVKVLYVSGATTVTW